jgi:hypothetical protein
MKRWMWLLFFSVLCQPLRASITLDTSKAQKTVVFLYAARSGGGVDEGHPLGTGFLVGTHARSDPRNSALLLVTARHIVDPNWMFCSAPQPDLLYVRLNKKKYDPSKDSTGVAYLPVALVEKDNKKRYFVSDDDRVDAAVVDFGWQNHSEDDYDFMPMDIALFASPDEIKILGIGDNIASAGLIPGKSGVKRNYPFFKFGNISSIPDEGVWVSCEKNMPELRLERVWFIAANLVGGNSGSPVFFFPPGAGGTGVSFGTGGVNVDRVALIGVQSSSFEGADVAGMTPVEDVFQIIKKYAPPDIDVDWYRGDPSKRPKE